MKSNTNPNVYIIESLDFDDEKEGRYEGQLLSDMLTLSGKQPIYKYVRTSQEFEYFLDDFIDSSYRYLHLSCHGSKISIATSLGEIAFEDLADMLNGRLKNKRIFISACEVVNEHFVEQIGMSSKCLSIIGPSTKLHTNDALIFWSSFYHILFRENPSSMNHKRILKALNGLTSLHNNFTMRYFRKVKNSFQNILNQ